MFLESVSSNPRWWYPPRSLVLQEDIKPRSLDCNLAFHKEVAHPFACLGAAFSRGVRPLSYSVFSLLAVLLVDIGSIEAVLLIDTGWHGN